MRSNLLSPAPCAEKDIVSAIEAYELNYRSYRELTGGKVLEEEYRTQAIRNTAAWPTRGRCSPGTCSGRTLPGNGSRCGRTRTTVPCWVSREDSRRRVGRWSLGCLSVPGSASCRPGPTVAETPRCTSLGWSCSGNFASSPRYAF